MSLFKEFPDVLISIACYHFWTQHEDKQVVNPLLCCFSQVYTGRYVPPAQRANPVLTVENCLSEITLGTFVTVHPDDCDN